MIRLNLASGPSLFPHPWVNIDREDQSDYIRRIRECANFTGWPAHQLKLAGYIKAGLVTSEVADIRKGLPQYGDGTVDAIYIGQAVEHFNPVHEVPKALAECFRLLKSGGKIRITTPDLLLILAHWKAGRMSDFASEQPVFYASASNDEQLSLLMYGATGPDCTWDHYEGHFACWSKDMASKYLRGAGFSMVTFGEKSSVFEDCVDCGMSHSFAVEAVRP